MNDAAPPHLRRLRLVVLSGILLAVAGVWSVVLSRETVALNARAEPWFAADGAAADALVRPADLVASTGRTAVASPWQS